MTNNTLSSAHSSGRVSSVDIMRGIVILSMVFVNDLADLSPKIVPQWLRHMDSGVDGFTFVDLIMPVFIFIIGISIPLALGKRLKKGESLLKIIGHVMIRTASLIIMGLMDINRGTYSLGMSVDVMYNWPQGLWKALAWTCIFMVWLDFPFKSKAALFAKKIAGITGIAGLVWLAMIFRTTDGGTFSTRGWGVLGILGWAYLFAALTWMVFRNNRLGIIGIFVLFHSTFLGITHGLFEGSLIVNRLGNAILGTFSANAIAGLFVGILLMEKTGPEEKIRNALWLSLFTFVAAIFLRPLGGLHMPSASWSLCATCCGSSLWALLYWSVDVKGWRKGLDHIRLIGSNCLFIYHLSRYSVYLYYVTGLTFYETLEGNLTTGIVRALLKTLVLSAITLFATKRRYFLRI